ncbi:MAG: HNH endonuclease [Planctomycetes bacterium]|nr:HNH endonuclease [Planctomycetota bacterium]
MTQESTPRSPPSFDPRGARIIELAAQRSVIEHALLTELRQFDREEGWRRDGAASCAAWLSWKTGEGERTARDKVRVARRLGELPEIDEDFSRGVLSYSQVRALVRIARPGLEPDLRELARRTSGAKLERVVRFIRLRAAADTGELAEEDLRLAFERFDDTGLELLRLRLRPEQGEALRRAIRSVKARASGGAGRSDMSDADALVALGALAAVAEREEPARQRFDVLVVVDEQVLREQGPRPPGARCELGTGAPISAETARRLTCDGATTPVLMQGETPLDLGRKRRRVSARLLRALLIRDGGCTFPGCTNREFLDAHHLEHWARGGRTNRANMTLLCWAHHRLVHEGGYRAVRTREGLVFLDPRGGVVPPGPRLTDQRRGGGDALARVRAGWPQARQTAGVPAFGGANAQAVREVIDRLRARLGPEPVSA